MDLRRCEDCRELVNVEDLDDEDRCAECRDEAKHERQLNLDYYSRLL